MSNTTHATEPARLALPAADLATRLGVSERHIWALNSSGRLPRPIRLGRAVRWNFSEIEAWLAVGAPSRDVWEAMKDSPKSPTH